MCIRDSPNALERIKARYLGKSGRITELLKGMAKLSPEERKTAGAAINRAKEAVEASLNARRDAIRRLALEARLAEESLDVTPVSATHLHGILARKGDRRK